MLRRPKNRAEFDLVFDHVSLAKKGPTLALRVPEGSTLAILGAAASGKSKLLSWIAGQATPTRGSIERPANSIAVLEPEWSRRETPMSMVREILGKGSLQRATDVLSALNLWEVRQKPCLGLSPGQQAAAIFIPALLGEARLICCDHRFDQLDWLVLEKVWTEFMVRRQSGLILAFTTYRPDLGDRADFVLVLKNEQLAFSGTPETLKRTVIETTLEVATDNQPGVRAIAEPFQVDIEEITSGLRLSTHEGQALAAKLLLEGYGDVEYVIQRSPTFAEALARVL